MKNLEKKDKIIEAKEEKINKIKSATDEYITNEIIKRMKNTKTDLFIKFEETFPEFKSDRFGVRNKILKRNINRRERENNVDFPLFSLLNKLSRNLFLTINKKQCSKIETYNLCACN